MAQSLPTAPEITDPRILRSRRMLMDALARLLMKKEFADISVQDIAAEATLNRATFYLHYPDKAALLQAMTEARFRDLIERRGIAFTDCHQALRAIALGVCDYLTEITNCSAKGGTIPFEGSVIPVVEAMFLQGLSHRQPAAGVDAALVATAAAWAVFGTARRWFRAPGRIPAEKMAVQIESLVKPIFLGPGDPKVAAGKPAAAVSKRRSKSSKPSP